MALLPLNLNLTDMQTRWAGILNPLIKAFTQSQGQASQTISVPVGSIIPFGGATAPAGFLLCQGQAVPRATYAALFAVIGTTYGAGNGSTTFNLPNFNQSPFVGNNSTSVTPNASGNWITMGCSLALTPGQWVLNGVAFLQAGATVTYGQCQTGWAGADGANNSSQPASVSSLTGVSIQAGVQGPAIVPAFNGDNQYQSLPVLRLTVTQNATVFVAVKFVGTTAANARLQVFAYAELEGLNSTNAKYIIAT